MSIDRIVNNVHMYYLQMKVWWVDGDTERSFIFSLSA